MSGTRRLSRADRQVLRESQKEAVGSAVMSGVCDNYLAAFAIFLNASAQQVGWVVAVPQLLGAWAQLLSVWVARRGVRRRLLTVCGAAFQSVTIAVLMALCARTIDHTILVLIVTAMLFQAGGHFVQPQWRSVMVMLVPIERRGRYFAHRARISAIASFAALAAGGLLLHVAKLLDSTAVGFAALFACALFGRIASVRLLLRLPDVEVEPQAHAKSPFAGAGREIRRTLEHLEYRRFIVFVAMMHGAVAVSGPFFSVHMLRNLGFSYVEFMSNLAASLIMQLLTLSSWGYISDHLGNRSVLITTAFIIPTLPMLWIFSDNYWYLLAVQGLSGLAWGGFALSSTNYLYDLRPPGSELAIFSAVHAVTSGLAIFAGAALGGALAAHLPADINLGGMDISFAKPLYGVFACSALLRLSVVLWFAPRVAEIRLSSSATINEVMIRMARINPVTGVVMDIIGAVRKRR
ncbi:MAG: MFS transporter [Proteobacteria bacterium]|nr:MFS transporter [Pseudomonadota bacterium]